MTKVDFKNKKSKLSKNICKWFKLYKNEDVTLGDVLDKYCENGMSRKYVANLLMEIKNEDNIRLGDSINIKETTIWENCKIERANNRCKFVLNSKFTGNNYHGNNGKIRQKNNKIVMVKYICSKCHNIHSQETKVSSAPKHLIALKAFKCPSCGEYSTCVGEFRIRNNSPLIRKAIINNTEQFISNKEQKNIPTLLKG